MRLSEKLWKTFQTAFKTVVVCIPGSINIRARITGIKNVLPFTGNSWNINSEILLLQRLPLY